VKIQLKTMLIVLPLILASLLLNSSISYLLARNGITELAIEYLDYKRDELEKYAKSQWELLSENKLTDNPQYIAIAEQAIESFARSLVRNESELIFTVRPDASIGIASSEIYLSTEEALALSELITNPESGWQKIKMNGENRVCQLSWFEEMGWYIFVSEKEKTFYQSSDKILYQSMLTLGITIITAFVLLYFFIRLITRPVGRMSAAMEQIIKTSNLDRKVTITNEDELGRLGHTFNIMTAQLNTAYKQIREFAHKAVVAKSRERYIRNIFQKYVPKNVIDQYIQVPDASLVGKEENLAVLFSDIRGFSRMLENKTSYEVIRCLSDYFEVMVKIIMERDGIVDKYIGDRMLTFFGSPVKNENDAMNAVLAALEMVHALEEFNIQQRMKNMPQFEIGIGIAYGKSIVGNVGSDLKMDFTIVGTPVKLSVKLQETTKVYHQPLIISAEVFHLINSEIPCRMIDMVHLSDLDQTMKIYAPKMELTGKEKHAWKYHKEGLLAYHNREFEKAKALFIKVKDILIDDVCAEIYIERCNNLLSSPPDDLWNGITVL
jgi:adenylate cyclase